LSLAFRREYFGRRFSLSHWPFVGRTLDDFQAFSGYIFGNFLSL